MKKSIIFLLSALVAVSGSGLQAFNIGDRAIGLGGAYTALSNDASSAWYNPAGLVKLPGYMLTASATAYQHKRTDRIDFIQFKEPTKTLKKDYVINSINVYPSTLIYAQSLGEGKLKHGIALSVLVKDSATDHGKLNFKNSEKTYHMTFETFNEFKDYYIGPSYAFGGRTFSGGISALVRYYDRSYAYNLYEDTSVTGQIQEISAKNFQETYSHYSLNPVIGLMYSPSSDFIIGLRGSIPSVSLGGSTQVNRVITTAGSEVFGGVDEHSQEHDEKTIKTLLKTPWSIRLGLAWLKKNSFALELTGELSGAVAQYRDRTSTLSNASAFEQNYYSQNMGYNLNLGFEYSVNQTYTIRTGVFTEFSHEDAFKPSIENMADNTLAGQHHEDSIGINMGLGQRTAEGDLSYSVSFRYGKGEAVGFLTVPPHSSLPLAADDSLYEKTVRIIDTRFWELNFYVSGTLADGKCDCSKD